jgi:hypothetical protein
MFGGIVEIIFHYHQGHRFFYSSTNPFYPLFDNQNQVSFISYQCRVHRELLEIKYSELSAFMAWKYGEFNG